MPAKLHLERKVRWTLGLIVVMLLSLLVLGARSCVASVTEQTIPDAGSTDERLVMIDGHSVLFDSGQLGQVMSGWVESSEQKTLSFELSDRSFVSSSSTPSQITLTRIGQVVQVTKANPTLTVHILVPVHIGNLVMKRIYEQRAARLRDALVSSGVSASHVTIEDDQRDLPGKSQLTVLLSK